MEYRKKQTLVSFTLVFLLLASFSLTLAAPDGATVNQESTDRATNASAETHEAGAGNVTEISLTGTSITQTWQGYFGNVTGAIELADSNDNVLYNWSLANPSGEVYAAKNGTVSWADIQCFNFTANGTHTDESGNGGTTNLAGINLTTLEAEYGLAATDADGVDETFTLSGAGTHDAFFTASQTFSEGECRNTRVFGDTGEGVNDEFEEVLLYEPTTSTVVFASILESSAVLGFDDNDHDFQMLVLEDGHGADVSTTTYYFFVELE